MLWIGGPYYTIIEPLSTTVTARHNEWCVCYLRSGAEDKESFQNYYSPAKLYDFMNVPMITLYKKKGSLKHFFIKKFFSFKMIVAKSLFAMIPVPLSKLYCLTSLEKN